METKIYQKHSTFVNSIEFKRYCILYKKNKDSIVNLDGMEFASETWTGRVISILIVLISMSLFLLPNILDEANFFEIIGGVVIFFIFGGFLIIPLSFAFSAILFSVIIKPIAQLIHKKSKNNREFNVLKTTLSSRLEELYYDINYYVETRSKELMQGLRTSTSFEDCKIMKNEFTNSFEFINRLHEFIDIRVYSFIWDAERIIKYDFDFVKFDEETKRRNERFLNNTRVISKSRTRQTTAIKTNNVGRKIDTQHIKNENQNILPRIQKVSTNNKIQHNSAGDINSPNKRKNSNIPLNPKPDKPERKKILSKIDVLRKELENTVKQGDNLKQEKTNSSTRRPFKINHEELNEKKMEIGRVGEEFVLFVEQEKLIDWDSPNKNRIQHVSTTNDGLGYDIISYDENGNEIFIEVKSTTKDKLDDFFFSINELNMMKELNDSYYLYRVYNLDLNKKQGKYIVYKGYRKIMDEFEFINEELSGKFDKSVIN